jgi:hypothetical protein
MKTPRRASTPASYIAASSGATFARRVYMGAGIYGLITVLPGFFSEARLGEMFPPAVTHPEIYYGFYAVTLAWQLAFLVIARDPERYRPLMWVTVVEKAGFVIAALWLVSTGRSPRITLAPAMGDFILGILFVWAYVRTREPVAA